MPDTDVDVRPNEREQTTSSCSHCRGAGRLVDAIPKSDWPALDWLSFDGEVCNNCGGTGKLTLPAV